MHLAVCDDNIADRKQTERLLSRQSDRIFKEYGDRIYIDSYGNEDAFMANPQMYGGLFIDMVSGDINGFDIVRLLLKLGIEKPIVMCSSTLNYRKMIEEAGIKADNIFFLDKPIKVAELTEMVDMIRELDSKTVPTLELSGKHETIYAHGEEIICVRKVKSELEVSLTNGRTFYVIGELFNLFDQCRVIFPEICPISDNGIINVNHIQKTSFGKVTMDNGLTLPIAFAYRGYIQKCKDILASQNK